MTFLTVQLIGLHFSKKESFHTLDPQKQLGLYIGGWVTAAMGNLT